MVRWMAKPVKIETSKISDDEQKPVFSPEEFYASTHSFQVKHQIKTFRNKQGQVIGYETGQKSVALQHPIAKKEWKQIERRAEASRILRTQEAKKPVAKKQPTAAETPLRLKKEPQITKSPIENIRRDALNRNLIGSEVRNLMTTPTPKKETFFSRVGGWFKRADVKAEKKISPYLNPLISEARAMKETAIKESKPSSMFSSLFHAPGVDIIRAAMKKNLTASTVRKEIVHDIPMGVKPFSAFVFGNVAGQLSEIKEHPVSVGSLYVGVSIATAGASSIAEGAAPIIKGVAESVPRVASAVKWGFKGLETGLAGLWAAQTTSDVLKSKRPLEELGRKTSGELLPFAGGMVTGKKLYTATKSFLIKRGAVKEALSSLKLSGQIGEYTKEPMRIIKSESLKGEFRMAGKKYKLKADISGVSVWDKKANLQTVTTSVKIGKKKYGRVSVFKAEQPKTSFLKYDLTSGGVKLQTRTLKSKPSKISIIQGTTYPVEDRLLNIKKGKPFKSVAVDLTDTFKLNVGGTKKGATVGATARTPFISITSGTRKAEIYRFKHLKLSGLGVEKPPKLRKGIDVSTFTEFKLQTQDALNRLKWQAKRGKYLFEEINRPMFKSKRGLKSSAVSFTKFKREKPTFSKPYRKISGVSKAFEDISGMVGEFAKGFKPKVSAPSFFIPPITPSMFRVEGTSANNFIYAPIEGQAPKQNIQSVPLQDLISTPEQKPAPVTVPDFVPAQVVQQETIAGVVTPPPELPPPPPPPTPPAIVPSMPAFSFKAPFIGFNVGGGSGGYAKKRQKGSVFKAGYSPSLTAAVMDITGKPTSTAIKSGLTLRPIKIKKVSL